MSACMDSMHDNDIKFHRDKQIIHQKGERERGERERERERERTIPHLD